MNEHIINRFINRSTIKLAASYLAIIMSMSIVFSVVLYNVSMKHLERPFLIRPLDSLRDEDVNTPKRLAEGSATNSSSAVNTIDEVTKNNLQERFETARHELLERIMLLNLITLCFGSIVSIVLANISLSSLRQVLSSQIRFVNNVSHELRTPLAVLQTSNEVALRKKHIDSEDARLLIERNVRQIKRLRDMSNSLLYLLNTQNEPVKLEPVELEKVVSEIKRDFENLVSEKSITIDVSKIEPKLTVNGNSQLIMRVLSILLENALKYSPKSSTVTVSAYADNKQNYISVKDEGKGIDSQNIPHLFKRFYSTSTNKDDIQDRGYGIGLSIAKQLAREMKGDIVVSSDQSGSQFCLVLQKT